MPDRIKDTDIFDRAAVAAAAVYDLPGRSLYLDGHSGLEIDRIFEGGSDDCGFFAAGLAWPERDALILAFRGSDEERDYASAVNMARCQYEPHRDALLAYVLEPRWRQVILAGHSLGGGLCQYLAYDLAERAADRVGALDVVTFNGIGGRYGITLMHGAVDETRVKSIRMAAFAHPDDLISRIGGQLCERVLMLKTRSRVLLPLAACHGIGHFLRVDGSDPLGSAYSHPDRPFGILETSRLVGMPLRKALTDWFEGRRIVALAGFWNVLRMIPTGERYQAVRFALSLTPLRRVARRLVQWRTALQRLWPERKGPGFDGRRERHG